MKLIQISLFLLLSISLLSQEGNKFQVADSIINVQHIIATDFNDETMQKIKARKTSYSAGILKFDNVLDENEDNKNKKFLSGCQCNLMMGKLTIGNAFGFMSGIVNVIEINIADSTYQSQIYYNTDGMKTHKLNPDGEFIEDIKVPLNKTRLEISPDSEFEHNGIIKGILTGVSIKYYQQDYSDIGHEEIQTKILSVFECKLEDYGQMMIDMGMGEELEKKIKEEMEKQSKKKN